MSTEIAVAEKSSGQTGKEAIRASKVKYITMTGIMAALITLMTAYICHVPVGANGGYVHFGDSLIYLAAVLLPRPYALAAAVGALGAVQIGLISSQKYAQGGQLDAPSHQQGGYKIPTKRGIAEVEGNEFVVNKKTTMQNLDMMYFVNGIKRKITMDDMQKFFNSDGKVRISPRHSLRYSQGGELPELTDFNLKEQINQQQEQPEINVVAQIVDIANSLENYDKIKILAGLNNE